MSQQEETKQLFDIIQANPKLRILPLVDTDCVPSDDFNSWVAQWGTAEIEEVWEAPCRERIYVKSLDYDELMEEIWDEDIADEITEEEARKIVDGYAWEKVIIVKIHP